MSGRFSASAWNTRASIYMPVPAMIHAMMAPNGPVAVAKRPGRLKMPAPTIEPTTMAVRAGRESFCSDLSATSTLQRHDYPVRHTPPFLIQPRLHRKGNCSTNDKLQLNCVDELSMESQDCAWRLFFRDFRPNRCEPLRALLRSQKRGFETHNASEDFANAARR